MAGEANADSKTTAVYLVEEEGQLSCQTSPCTEKAGKTFDVAFTSWTVHWSL